MFYAGVANKKKGNFNLLTTEYVLSGTSSILDAGDNVIMGNSDSSQIRVVDNSFAATAAFKAAMSGIPMYYELSEPVVADVTTQMADFPDNFAVAAGDTIAFENDNHVAAASTVKYLRALGEVEA